MPRSTAKYPSHALTTPAYYSPRSSYPSFLSLPETLKLHIGFFWRGIVDASRWDTTVRTVYSDSQTRSHVSKSFILNMLSLVSICTFDLLLLPLVKGHHKWMYRNIGLAYRVLWILPLAAVSLYLNGSWAGIVAQRSYALKHGTRSTVPPSSSYSGILTAAATSAYRVAMIITSIALTFTLSYVPIVGPPLGFVFLCFVNAYYCFEFTWIARGLTLSQRVRFVEERWAYHFAFGLPSAAVCAFCSSLAAAAVFALLLPYYIIKAVHAHPVPTRPYSPILPPSTPGNGPQGGPPAILHPSPFIPIRIPIFDPVIAIDNFIVRLLSAGSPLHKPVSVGTPRDAETWQSIPDVDAAANAEEGNFSTNSRLKPQRKLD